MSEAKLKEENSSTPKNEKEDAEELTDPAAGLTPLENMNRKMEIV